MGDVKWPNGGNHILEEVKNHHSVTIKDMETRSKSHIEALDRYVQALDKKVDKKVDQVEEKIDKLAQQIQALDKKVDQVEEKIDKLAQQMKEIKNLMGEFIKKM